MAKKIVGPFEYLAQFNKLLAKPGALLTTMDRDGKANVMAIGWAHIGIVWSRRVCIVYVRPSRHSYTCLEQLRQFTVNTATEQMAPAVELCGTVSGRDKDKFAAAKLTVMAAQKVKPPIIEKCILHYECNVLGYNDLLLPNLQRDVLDSCYSNGDFHRVWFGEIIACYGNVEALRAIT